MEMTELGIVNSEIELLKNEVENASSQMTITVSGIV